MYIVYLIIFYFNKVVILLICGLEYIIKDDNNKTCFEVKTDVEFILINGNEIIKFDGINFIVKGGECVKLIDFVVLLILSIVKDDFLILIFKIDV